MSQCQTGLLELERRGYIVRRIEGYSAIDQARNQLSSDALAEDYAFCHRARLCGFPIVAETSIRLWHVGDYAYSWEDAGIDRQRFGDSHFQLAES